MTARDLRVEHRYANEIPREAVTDVGRAVGHVVIVPVLRDAILFSQHLAPADRTGLDAVVPVGDRAVHVTPKNGFQPPRGSIVDVLAAFDPTAVTVEGAGDAAVVVASGALVLAVDGGADNPDGPGSNAGVTLLVTDTEARVLAFAAATGDLTLAVDPPESACCGDAAR